jgi:hypothetical protein
MPYLDQAPIYEAIRRVYPDVWKWKYLPLYGYVVRDMRYSWLIGLKALAGLQPKEDTHKGFMLRYTRWAGDFENLARVLLDAGARTRPQAGLR